MENQQPLKNYRSQSKSKEDQYANDIKQLIVERHSLKQRIKGTDPSSIIPDMSNLNNWNQFKRPASEFKRVNRNIQQPPLQQLNIYNNQQPISNQQYKSITPIKSHRSTNSNNKNILDSKQNPLLNSNKVNQDQNQMLDDFQNLLINLSNCKSNSKSQQKNNPGNFVRNFNLNDQNLNPNNLNNHHFFSEIINHQKDGAISDRKHNNEKNESDLTSVKKNYEIRLSKVQNRLKQRLSIYLDQIEINTISILHTIKPSNVSRMTNNSQSMISDQSIFNDNNEIGDEGINKGKMKEMKGFCQSIIQNVEEATKVIRQTLLSDGQMVGKGDSEYKDNRNEDSYGKNEEKNIEKEREKVKKQFFKLRQDVLTSESMKRQFDRKEKQLMTQIANQESILQQKDNIIRDLQVQLEDLSTALKTHQEILQQQDLQIQDQFQNTQQLQLEYTNKQLEQEERLIQLQQIEERLVSDKRELEETLERDRRLMRDQIDILKEGKNKVDQNNQLLNQKLDYMQQIQNQSQSAQISELQIKLDGIMNNYELLKQQSQVLEIQIETQRKENKLLSEDNLTFKKESEIVQQNNQQQLVQINDLKHQLKEYDIRYKDLQERSQDYQHQLDLNQNQLENLKIQVEEKRREIQTLHSKIEQLETERTDLKINLSKFEEHILQLKHEKEIYQANMDSNSNRIVSQKDHLIQELQDQRILNVKHESELRVKEEQLNLKESEIIKMREIIEEQEQQNNQLLSVNSELKQIKEDQRNEIQDYKLNQVHLQRELDTHNIKYKQLIEEYENIQQQLTLLKNIELEVKQKDQEMQLAKLGYAQEKDISLKQLQELNVMNEKLNSQLIEVKSQFNTQKIILDEKLKTVHEMEVKNQSLEQEKVHLQTQVEKLQSKIKLVKQQKLAEIDDIKQQVSKELQLKDQEIQNMFQKTQILDEEISNIQKNVQKQKSDHKLQLDQLSLTLTQKQTLVDQQDVELKSLHELTSEYQNQAQVYERKITQYKSKLQNLTTDNLRLKKTLEQQILDNNTLSKQIDHILIENDQEKQQFKQDLVQLKNRLSELNQVELCYQDQIKVQKSVFDQEIKQLKIDHLNELNNQKYQQDVKIKEVQKSKSKELQEYISQLNQVQDNYYNMRKQVDFSNICRQLTSLTNFQDVKKDTILHEKDVQNYMKAFINFILSSLKQKFFNQAIVYESLKTSHSQDPNFDYESNLEQIEKQILSYQMNLSSMTSIEVKDLIAVVIVEVNKRLSHQSVEQEGKKLLKNMSELFKIKTSESKEWQLQQIIETLNKNIDESDMCQLIHSYLQLNKNLQNSTERYHLQEQQFQQIISCINKDKDHQQRVFSEQLLVIRKERDEFKVKVKELEMTNSMRQSNSNKSIFTSQIFDKNNNNMLNSYQSERQFGGQGLSKCVSYASVGHQSNKSTDVSGQQLLNKSQSDNEDTHIHKYYKEREKEYLKMIDMNQKEVQRLRNLIVTQ
eukprot:403347067